MLCDHKQCTGCAACAAVCPVGAIQMQQDVDGFYFPKVEESCIHCGKCEHTCPVLTPRSRPDAVYPQAYVMKHNDRDVLLQSASGGMFTLLAQWAFAQNGCVYGACWDENFHVQLRRADSMEQLAPMRGSKYVYSHAKAVYRDAEQQLKAGRTVVFTGVPCQIAALYSVLQGREYPNLYTAEIVCHGAGSEKVFDAYLADIQAQSGKKLKALDQTSKKRPWTKLIQKYICRTWADGTQEYLDFSADAYLAIYMADVCINEACHACQYASLPRRADITMGDFMGYGVVNKRATLPKDGVSAVWVNTEKGQNLKKALQAQGTAQWEPCTLQECMAFNHALWKPTKRSAGREQFWIKFHAMPFSQLCAERFNGKYRAVRMIKSGVTHTIGPHLTACGMYAVMKKNGVPTKVEQRLELLQSSVHSNGKELEHGR